LISAMGMTRGFTPSSLSEPLAGRQPINGLTFAA
jgi:hypothetical protein